MDPMLTIALRAARAASKHIAQQYDRLDRVKVTSKGHNDFVTEVDQKAEELILEVLKEKYPAHHFLGEESGETGRSGDSDYQWIIDPLDGTTNFIRGIPHFAVSIACAYKGKIEHAVIIDPLRNEEYTASRGRGVQLNGTRLRVSNRQNLDGALIGTGIPYKNRSENRIPAYVKSLEAVASQTAGIRRAGAAALDLAYVAAGRLDGFWEVELHSWDIAAGVLMVREAGGLISDLGGGNDYMESGNIACGNPKVLQHLLKAVRPHLG